MTERELREGLSLATANEPPLAFDPDALITRAQRETRRRRSLMGVGAATALVAVAAVAVSTTLTGAHSQRVATGAAVLSTTRTTPTTTTAPPVMVWPPANPGKFTDDRAQLAKLSSKWTNEVVRRMPLVVPAATKIHVEPWQGEAAGPLNDGQDYLNTFVEFTIAGHRTAINIQVMAPGAVKDGPEQQCASRGRTVTRGGFTETGSCRVAPGPGGTALVVEEDGQQQSGHEASQIITVRHYRLNGTSLMVSGYNYDPVGGNDRADAIPVSEQQLTAFALDPVLDYVTG